MKNYSSSNSTGAFLTHSVPSKPLYPYQSSNGNMPTFSEDTTHFDDIKEEYGKALKYIEKLKSEQNNLKNVLKASADTKEQSPLLEESYSYNQPAQKGKDFKDIERRLLELEIENSELKTHIDTTMVRLAKIQREKQVLQDKLNNSETNSPSNNELLSEVKLLSQEVQTLKKRLHDVEGENSRLKQKDNRANTINNQKPSQSLLRYVNYVSKLIGSMSLSSFARTCFDERFPKEFSACSLLESGQFETVLLKAFKYITDLLININSLNPEGNVSQTFGPQVEPSNQYVNRQGSKGTSSIDNRSFKSDLRERGKERQLSHENQEFVPSRLRFETTETVSTLTSPKTKDYVDNEAERSSREYEKSRNPLDKVLGTNEETRAYKKPQRKHVRHYSSITGYTGQTQDGFRGDEVKESYRQKKDALNWDAQYNISPITSVRDDMTVSVHTRSRGNDNNSRNSEAGTPEIPSHYRVKQLLDENPSNNSRHNNHTPVEKEQLRQVKSSRFESYNMEEREPIKNDGGVYKSKYVKSRVAATSRSEKEEKEPRPEEQLENRNYVNYLKHTKNAKNAREEVAARDNQDLEEEPIPVNRRRNNIETTDDSRQNHMSAQEREIYEIQQRQKNRGKVCPQSGTTEYIYRSRSMPQNQEIIEEASEAEKTQDDTYRDDKKMRDTNPKGQDHEEDDYEDGQEIWERKREELARLSRKASGQPSPSVESKSKDFTTFRVSFGRTESKSKKSPSPSPVHSIMDVPRKKRIDHNELKFDVITGGDLKKIGSQTTKAEGRRANVRFADELRGEPESAKNNKSSIRLEKMCSDSEIDYVKRE